MVRPPRLFLPSVNTINNPVLCLLDRMDLFVFMCALTRSSHALHNHRPVHRTSSSKQYCFEIISLFSSLCPPLVFLQGNAEICRLSWKCIACHNENAVKPHFWRVKSREMETSFKGPYSHNESVKERVKGQNIRFFFARSST